MRLNRFLAAAGLGSRRSCEDIIASGAVVINGSRIESLSTLVSADDDVRVNGRKVHVAAPLALLLNKPKGFLVTRSDEKGRRTIYDLLEPGLSNLFHVGRLDKESEGLLIMTNDGLLSQRLLHPSHGVEKEYEVTLDRSFDPLHTEKLLRGVHIEGGRGRFESVRIVAPKTIRVILKQGIKRQIRLMLYRLGYEVLRLRRIRIGPLTDHKLPVGAWRHITVKELDLLAKSAKPKEKSRSTSKPSAGSKPPAKPKPKTKPKLALASQKNRKHEPVRSPRR
jgi:23S rRNA pseudouridine2605 synthase